MTRHLSARLKASFPRKESLCYDDLSHQKQISKLIAELSFTIEEIQAATVKMLKQNEEMVSGRRANLLRKIENREG